MHVECIITWCGGKVKTLHGVCSGVSTPGPTRAQALVNYLIKLATC